MKEEMVNSFIGGILNGVVGMLVRYLQHKCEIIGELPDVMKSLEDELTIVMGLTEAEPVEDISRNSVGVWWSKLLDVAYEAEEVVDEFEYLISGSPQILIWGVKKGFYDHLGCLPARNRIAIRGKQVLNDFESIHTAIDKQKRTGNNLFGTRSAPASYSGDLQPQRSFPDDYSNRLFVGRDQEQKNLVYALIYREGERERVVIIVKGMLGVGKTALVHRAYSMVNQNFTSKAWLNVSPSYSISHLRDELSRQIVGPSPSNKDTMASNLNAQLMKNKYLIVLDGISDCQVMDDLFKLIPSNDKGSRIIITTPDEWVATSSSKSQKGQVFTLKPLSPEHAWNLFVQLAFAGETWPPNLNNTVRSIVNKCGGLPPAIVSMAELMKKIGETFQIWERVEEDFEGNLVKHKECEVVKMTLLRSFNKMSIHLKRCFLYMAIFPQNFMIKKKKLIRLWIAEGIVRKEPSGRTIEEHAEDYFEELHGHNLIEISDESCKITYRMNNLMRQMTLWVARNKKFLVIHDGKTKNPCCQARRLSIQTTGESICLDCEGQAHVHSILNFDTCCAVDDHHNLFSLRKMWSHAKFLRVLDLEGLRISIILDGLNELFNLRYLSLRNTGIMNLPDGLEKLGCLETIDFRGTGLEKIPLAKGFKSVLPSDHVYSKYLQRLRHFYVGPSPPNHGYVVSLGISLPKGVCQFINLQTLAHVKADQAFLTKVRNLVQLKKLSITDVKESDAEILLDSLMKLIRLKNLSITAAIGKPLNLEMAAFSPPASIRKLMLMGRLRGDTLPTWILSLERLTHLRLRSSKLQADPFATLRDLLNLEHIQLKDAYMGTELNVTAASFHYLKKIELWDLPNLEEIKMVRPSTSMALYMYVHNCMKIKSEGLLLEQLRSQGCKYVNATP